MVSVFAKFLNFFKFISVLVYIVGLNAYSQNSVVNEPLRRLNIGVYVSPPFVMETDGDLSGMSIELWEHVARQLNIDSNYIIYNNFQELVEATSNDSVSIAVTNLTINNDRAKIIDFSQPWYDAGLKIMITENRESNSSDILNGLHDAGFIKTYLFFGVIVLVLTFLMTVFDRKFDKEFPKDWRDGLAESFYQVVMMLTSGKLTRKNLFGWIGRIVSAIWLVIGILVVAYVTSSITSVMTQLSISNNINSLNDLNGKKIGILKGSETEIFIQHKGLDYIAYESLDEMVEGLEGTIVDAIVADAPVLDFYEFTHQNKKLEVVGSLFKPDKYGFGISPQSDLDKQITLEILKAQESGYIQRLKTNYFGTF